MVRFSKAMPNGIAPGAACGMPMRIEVRPLELRFPGHPNRRRDWKSLGLPCNRLHPDRRTNADARLAWLEAIRLQLRDTCDI